MPSSALAPSVQDVAALLRARTKLPNTAGAEAGTFNDLTRPTGDEVERLIAEAVLEVTGKIGTPEPGSDLEARARGAVALYAAMLVELSYFPEQVKSDRSPFTAYERLYDSRIKSLIADAQSGGDGGGEGGDGDSPPADAAWWFPDDAGGLVGWQTQF